MSPPPFERGRRRDGSSSSRESSPHSKKRRRSFSPASDDGTVIPEMHDDDTPPPPNAPLLREPVAFSSVLRRSTAPVNMYQATIATPIRHPRYLPGQGVPSSTQKAGTPIKTSTTSPAPSIRYEPRTTRTPSPPSDTTTPTAATTAPASHRSVPPAQPPSRPVLTPPAAPLASVTSPPHAVPPATAGSATSTPSRSQIAIYSSAPTGRLAPSGPKTAPAPQKPAPPAAQPSQASTQIVATIVSNPTRKHFNDGFAEKTSTFRVKGYTPSGNGQEVVNSPPLQAGKGPYSSLFRTSRAVTYSPFASAGSTTAATTSSASSSSKTGKEDLTLSSLEGESEVDTPSPPSHNAEPHKAPDPPLTKASSTAKVKPKRAKADIKNKKPKPRHAAKDSATVKPQEASHGVNGTSAAPSLSLHSFSPRTTPHQVVAQSLPSSASSSTFPDFHVPANNDYDATSSQAPHHVRQQSKPGWADRGYHTDSDKHPRARSPDLSIVKHPPAPAAVAKNEWTGSTHLNPLSIVRHLRMVTLLIVDGRSGQLDHQLAEVKVPLRPTDTVDEGYWANAKDVCEQLQASPSRIDGPARVYTLRGRYRQFFLRVSERGVDDCTSANLRISSDRTLDVVVELPPSLGKLPPPPKIPPELLPSTVPSHSHHHSSSSYPTQQRRGSTSTSEDYRMGNTAERSQYIRSTSRGEDDYDMDEESRYQAPSSSRQSSPRSMETASSGPSVPAYESPATSPSCFETSFARGAQQQQMADDHRSYDRSPCQSVASLTSPAVYRERALAQSRRDRETGSPEPQASNEEIDEALLHYVKSKIEPEPMWAQFFKWKGSPATAAVVLEMYKYVQSKIDEHAGTLPYRSLNAKVHPSHILRALHLDEEWGRACLETLKLLSLYGPGGKRSEDPRVIDLIKDTTIPSHNAKPIKRLLRLLKDINAGWQDQHSNFYPESTSARRSIDCSN